MILSPHTNPEFVKAILTNILKYLQLDSQDSNADSNTGTGTTPPGLWLVTAALPAILSRICIDEKKYINVLSNNNEESIQVVIITGVAAIDLLMIQILFLLFSLSQEIHREDSLALILSPLSEFMNIRSIESPIIQLCGKGITNIARLYPDIFRRQVSLLSEQLRSVLQNVMRYVLEQVSTTSSGTSNSQIDAGGNNIKKIDMSRYKKT
jgi:hypothetical protein